MDKLTEIMNHKRRDLARRSRPVHQHELARFRNGSHRRRFEQALHHPHGLAVIAEMKRKSPSAGDIAAGRDAPEQARLYYNAGADALSVLTDETFFGGSIRDLWEVNDLLANRPDSPPTLRKDFFVDPLQILEAAEAGAAAVLLIVRALSDDELRQLFHAAESAGLCALFEVHKEDEIQRALHAGARIIGVNNRDLARFSTDLAVSEKLIPRLPDSVTAVSESGIFSPDDAARAFHAGAHAVLIGEALMKMDDPEPFLHQLHSLAP